MSMLLKDVQDTLEQYAKSNTDLNHTVGNTAFVRLYSTEALEAVKKAISKNVLLVTAFRGRTVGEYDSAKMQQYIGLRFTSYAPVSEANAGREAALNKSYEIMLDFVARLRYDYEQDTCSWLHWVEWTGIDWDEIDPQPWLVNHYGWDLVLPFRTTMPAYNPEKWRAMEHSSEYSTEFQ